MNIKEYKTASGGNLNELDAEVNQLIKAGYQPFGSPYYIGRTEGKVDEPICQALVKYELVQSGSTLTSSLGARGG